MLTSYVFWLVLGLLCLGLEIILPSFVFAVFGIAGILTAVVAFFTKDFSTLAITFCGSGSLIFVFLRPWYLKQVLKNSVDQKFGFHSLVGKTGLVTQSTLPEKAGYIKVDADEWKAFASEPIEAGQQAKIIKLEGGNTVWIEKI